MILRALAQISLAVLGLGVVQVRPSGLEYGPRAVGFRTEVLSAHDGLPAGRIQLWYPATAPCASPLSYGDYLRIDAQYPGDDVAAQLRQGWAMTAPALDDAQWARVTTTPLRACRDAAPAKTRAPLLVAIQLPGAWPVAAEYFASHGYAVAVVSRPLTSAPTGELVDRVTQRKLGFVHDLEDAIELLRPRPDIDTARIGAVGQNHALLMLAMRRPDLRAVALQDSAFQEGLDAESNRRTGLWQPDRYNAALLHAITSDRLKDETAWDAFRSSMTGAWTRLVIAPPHAGHNDVTADGYLMRLAAPATTTQETLIKVFEGLLRAQRAFFDRHVAGRADAPAITSFLDRTLFRVDTR